MRAAVAVLFRVPPEPLMTSDAGAICVVFVTKSCLHHFDEDAGEAPILKRKKLRRINAAFVTDSRSLLNANLTSQP